MTIGLDPTILTGTTIDFVGLASTVRGSTDGGQALTINGATTFGGAVGDASKRLKSLTVNGTTAINGGAANTTGAQSYTGAVTIGLDPTILTGTTIDFVGLASTVRGSTDGGQALTIDGATTFGGAVGDAAKRLKSLTVNGTTAINGGGVATTATQSYTGAVTIGLDPTTLTGMAVDFVGLASTVRGSTDGGQALTINGATTFGGAVGNGAKRLKSLAIIGTTAINGGGVTTTTTQSYAGAVAIGLDPTTLTGTAVDFVGLASTVRGLTDGGQALTINGATTFGGAVGDGAKRLKSLTVNGTTAINGGGANTTGAELHRRGDDWPGPDNLDRHGDRFRRRGQHGARVDRRRSGLNDQWRDNLWRCGG